MFSSLLLLQWNGFSIRNFRIVSFTEMMLRKRIVTGKWAPNRTSSFVSLYIWSEKLKWMKLEWVINPIYEHFSVFIFNIFAYAIFEMDQSHYGKWNYWISNEYMNIIEMNHQMESNFFSFINWEFFFCASLSHSK